MFNSTINVAIDKIYNSPASDNENHKSTFLGIEILTRFNTNNRNNEPVNSDNTIA